MRRAGAVLLALAAAGTGCAGGAGTGDVAPRRADPASSPTRLAVRTAAPAPRPPLPLRAAGGGDLGARIRRPVLLRVRPSGPVVARLTARTAFGSPQVLAVVRRRPGWLGVLATQRPNGTVGWIPARGVELVREPVRVRVDLARRRLLVLRGRRVLLRAEVGVGAPGTPTPTGTFAATDGLVIHGARAFGCCALALTGRQPRLPDGWTSGDRLAVHGTDAPATIGAASSHGCLHARDADLRRLLDLVPLGARVEIRAS